jgi:hypothetical protein
MRKLLLSTSALIAAGTISSTAMSEVSSSISGNYTFSYQSYDSGITYSGASGDEFYNTANINFGFTNKTDSGLEIGMLAVMNFKGTQNSGSDSFTIDDHRMTIKGGFGTIQLGSDDGAGDQLTRSASDLIGRDALNSGETTSFHPGATANWVNNQNASNGLKDDNADLPSQDVDDEANITYILPTMGGLTAGVSYRDGGKNNDMNDDVTEFAAKYAFESGGVSGTLHYGQNTKDSTTVGGTDLDASSMGVDVTMGPLRAVFAQAEVDTTATIKTEITDFGIQYVVGNGLTLAAVQTEVEEPGGDGETLDVTSISAKYNIASGLDAYVTYHDYDYENGTSGGTDDDGSATMISLVATF